MILKEFLNYILVETKEFDITVYGVLTVLLILFVTYILWITALIVSLQPLGIKLTLLLAGSAAILVGLGLGLQQIFQDIMPGITILPEGTLKVGDIVEIQDDIVGRVIEIGLRTSKIETRDNIIMVVPNSKFVTDIVNNWSHMEKRTRFHINVGVAYGSDVEKVTRILLECANDHEKISQTVKPFVRFKDFGDSSLDFQLFFWTTETFQVENIKSEIRYDIDASFRGQNVQIPFPQRDVHIKSKSQNK
jgi:small-conductance mechanosensitive channel